MALTHAALNITLSACHMIRGDSSTWISQSARTCLAFFCSSTREIYIGEVSEPTREASAPCSSMCRLNGQQVSSLNMCVCIYLCFNVCECACADRYGVCVNRGQGEKPLPAYRMPIVRYSSWISFTRTSPAALACRAARSRSRDSRCSAANRADAEARAARSAMQLLRCAARSW
jgi:hypothetical protein